MASIAFDSSGTRDGSKPPISLHPAFPAIVALWFAALLGLGSMVLPVVLVERAVELSGLSALVPAAAPPLGLMARGLIALAASLAGAALVVAIARRVARAHDRERPSRFAKLARGVRRPIDVNEELGGEGLVNGFGLPINRRRALAIAEDERPSDFLYMAPLPGHDGDDAAAASGPAEEPFELSDAFEDAADSTDPEAWAPPQPAADEDSPMTFKQEFQPHPPEPRAAARQEFMPEPEPEPEPVSKAAEPLAFSAPSLARHAPEAESLATEPVAAPAVPQPYEPEPIAAEPQPFRGDWSSAPVGELGLVQLVQRLGASIERRREWLATAVAAPVAAPAPAPAVDFEPAPAEEAAQAMAAYFGKPADGAAGVAAEEPAPAPPAPAGLGPRPSVLGSWPETDDDDDDDALPSFTLPLRKAVAPTIAFEEPEAPENDDDEDDDSYSSLLTMRNPFAPKDNGFVRIDEPEADDEAVEPAVVFPGHGDAPAAFAGPSAPRAFDPPTGAGAEQAPRSPAAPAEADAALRAALATLQRMSGTA